jgi:hypothetical protein
MLTRDSQKLMIPFPKLGSESLVVDGFDNSNKNVKSGVINTKLGDINKSRNKTQDQGRGN